MVGPIAAAILSPSEGFEVRARERRLTHPTCGEHSPRLGPENGNRRNFLLSMAIFEMARARAIVTRVSTTGDRLLVEKSLAPRDEP
jgi:hypothetical protein